MNLALVQYCFDGDEHIIIPRPHANSTRPESYGRTMPSTLKKLKSVAADFTLSSLFALHKLKIYELHQVLVHSLVTGSKWLISEDAEMMTRSNIVAKKRIHYFLLC